MLFGVLRDAEVSAVSLYSPLQSSYNTQNILFGIFSAYAHSIILIDLIFSPT